MSAPEAETLAAGPQPEPEQRPGTAPGDSAAAGRWGLGALFDASAAQAAREADTAMREAAQAEAYGSAHANMRLDNFLRHAPQPAAAAEVQPAPDTARYLAENARAAERLAAGLEHEPDWREQTAAALAPAALGGPAEPPLALASAGEPPDVAGQSSTGRGTQNPSPGVSTTGLHTQEAGRTPVNLAGHPHAETGEDSDIQPDPHIGAIAAEHAQEYEPGPDPEPQPEPEASTPLEPDEADDAPAASEPGKDGPVTEPGEDTPAAAEADDAAPAGAADTTAGETSTTT
jgi:hypothetical protein